MAELDLELREQLAENSSSAEELEELAEDDEDYVRTLVAENSNTPSSILEKLALDDDTSVRSGVAVNSNTPSSLLEKLARPFGPPAWLRCRSSEGGSALMPLNIQKVVRRIFACVNNSPVC